MCSPGALVGGRGGRDVSRGLPTSTFDVPPFDDATGSLSLSFFAIYYMLSIARFKADVCDSYINNANLALLLFP